MRAVFGRNMPADGWYSGLDNLKCLRAAFDWRWLTRLKF